MYVKQVEMAADGPDGVGGAGVAAFPVRLEDVREAARRGDRQPVREWRHLSWGRDAGVAAVCAVAGVVPALPRGEGGAGAVGERQQRVHAGFEELAAYLAQVTDRTAVSRLLGISWVRWAASWNGLWRGGWTGLGSPS